MDYWSGSVTTDLLELKLGICDMVSGNVPPNIRKEGLADVVANRELVLRCYFRQIHICRMETVSRPVK